MPIPTHVYDPPFRITRASHVVLGVHDLKASRSFYTDVAGLVVTTETSDAVYLRGLEEACHHSLVLRRSEQPEAARIGLRVLTEEDLDRAHAHLTRIGLEPRWVEIPNQGRTLHVSDPVGTPLELVAQMPVVRRLLTRFSAWRGGAAQRLDHTQILTPRVKEACAFYVGLGFKLTEYIGPPGPFAPAGVFLARKGNPHDIVFFNGAGPRLHHVAYMVPEMHNILTACDIAGELGHPDCIERGPQRHGPGHAMFVYLRDPDGHRLELFNTHYQIIDMELEPVRWDPKELLPWGMPAQRSWHEEATRFAGVEPVAPAGSGGPLTLERYLESKAKR